MTKNRKSLREALSDAISERRAQTEAQPRQKDGKFAAKTGSAPESVLLAEDYSGSFDPASLGFGFHAPDLVALGPSDARNPITDPRLTGTAKTRLSRLVEEKNLTAITSSSPDDGAPFTMLYVGDVSIYSVGETPKTTEEALAVVARRAADGDEGAVEFLESAFGDEAEGLIEYVGEERH